MTGAEGLDREMLNGQSPRYTPELIGLRFQGSDEDREAMAQWLSQRPLGVKLEVLKK